MASPILRHVNLIVLNFSLFPKMRCLHDAECRYYNSEQINSNTLMYPSEL